jgi:hypothetical protein
MRFCGSREQFFMDSLADVIVRAFKEINFEGDLNISEASCRPGSTLTMLKGD